MRFGLLLRERRWIKRSGAIKDMGESNSRWVIVGV